MKNLIEDYETEEFSEKLVVFTNKLTDSEMLILKDFVETELEKEEDPQVYNVLVLLQSNINRKIKRVALKLLDSF